MELYTVSVVMSILCLSAREATGGGCSGMSGAEMEKSRLDQLRANILAQIGPIEPLGEDLPQLTEEEELELNSTIAIYEKIKDQDAQPKCRSEEFYAKPVTTFTGAISLSDGSEANRVEAELHSGPFEGVLLKKYIINFQTVELSKDKNVVSAADLLLYQSLTNTVDQPVRDETQEVHIRAIINNVQYFIVKKNLNVFAQGPHIFNVTRAIVIAVEEGARGPVQFEVLVTCSSSLDCNSAMPYGPDSKLMTPAAVTFDYGHTNSSKEPRIVVVSKNPQDVQHWSSRRKRSASTDSNFCISEQVTCCVHRFNISFEDDLGLNNVHLPASFTANYCDGFCSTLTREGSSDRNRFLESLRNNPSISVEPCCSGLEYKSLAVLLKVYDRASRRIRFVIDYLDQIEVTKCTCA